MVFKIYMFSVIFFLWLPLQAQEKKWTLQECIDYGVEQSLQMQRQKIQNKNDRLSLRDAILDLTPSVGSISPSTTFNYGRGIDPETNTYTNVQNNTIGGFGVGVGMTLFAGFSGVNRLRIAKISKLQGLEATEGLANDIAMQIMAAFFTLVYAEEQIRITTEQLDNSALQLKKMQREYELGRRPKSDLFDMEAQQASDEYQLALCHNNRANALVNLAHLMNYQEEKELEVDVTVLAGVIPVWEQTNIRNVYERAMQELPDALISEYNVRMSELRVYTARASLYPSISMNGGISFGYYSSQSDLGFWKQISDKNRIGKYVGLSMNIPIFSGLSRRSGLSRAKNSYQSARIQHQQTEQSLYTEIQKAVLDLESLVQQFGTAQKKENFSRLANDAGRKKYEQGLITIIELNTTSNSLLQAKYDLLRARLNYVMQKRMVDFYKGTPLQRKVGGQRD